MELAPRAQLNPILSKGIWEIEVKKASAVWPESVRPLSSVIVPETIIGSSIFFSSKTSSIANNAALQFKVSKTVSTNNISTPPSTKPITCSLYAFLSWSNVIPLKAGFSTSGEIDAVLFVGPIDPATNLGFSFDEYFFAAFFAICADW